MRYRMLVTLVSMAVGIASLGCANNTLTQKPKVAKTLMGVVITSIKIEGDRGEVVADAIRTQLYIRGAQPGEKGVSLEGLVRWEVSQAGKSEFPIRLEVNIRSIPGSYLGFAGVATVGTGMASVLGPHSTFTDFAAIAARRIVDQFSEQAPVKAEEKPKRAKSK